MKVIFLDIDGPMLPARAYLLPNASQALLPSTRVQDDMIFDPIACAMINRLVAASGAMLVISSSWRAEGRPVLVQVLMQNGIRPTLHDDWRTSDLVPPGSRFSEVRDGVVSARSYQVKEWLSRHPEVTHWVAFDDETVPEPGGIVCSFDDGLQMSHFVRAGKLLGVTRDALATDGGIAILGEPA